MPMRGKLRYSFRCTWILSWVLVVWNKYSILPQRDSRTSLVLVHFCRRNCPAGPASSFGPLWTLRKGRRSGVGDCPGYCPTLLIWPAVWGFLHQDVSPAVWGFFKLMMFRLQFWDAFLIQNFSPAVSGWRLLNSRCFT